MRKTLFLILTIILSQIIFEKSIAQRGVAVPFLVYDEFAKGNGMAGAMTSVSHDASAGFYNPACLVRTKLIGADINYREWLPNHSITDDYLIQTSVAFTKERLGSFGLNFCRLNLLDNVWTDETGVDIGTFDAYEWMFSLGYAYPFSPSLSFGINLKLIRSKLGIDSNEGNTTAYAFDIGFLQQNLLSGLCYRKKYKSEQYSKWLMHRQAPGISLGFSLLNNGTNVNYVKGSKAYPLPQTLKAGISWNYLDTDVIGLITSFDIHKLLVHKDNKGEPDPFYKALFTAWDDRVLNEMAFAVGQQISIMSVFAFRTGFYYKEDEYSIWKHLTYGFSFGPETLNFNTSWIWTWHDENNRNNGTLFLGLSMAY